MSLAVSTLCQVVRQQGVVLEHRDIKAIECRTRDRVDIELGDATLRCRAVVVATGAWTRHLLPQARLDVRSIPLARVLTDNDWSMPIIDSVAQSYAIPLTRNLRDRAVVRLCNERPRIGCAARVRQLQRRWPSVAGFCVEQYLAAGMSGLGFKLAPGIARIACDQLLGRLRGGDHPCSDWSALSPQRFMPDINSSSVQP